MMRALSSGQGGIALDVRDLVVEIEVDDVRMRPIDGVSLQLRNGEILGLVGESGSGKSLTGLSIMGLISPPIRVTSGQILFNGVDLRRLDEGGLRRIRGSRIALIPQNPMSTLCPTLRIQSQMMDAIVAHESISRAVAWQRCRDALGRLGVPSPDERMAAYPHELSGGLRQRVAIAIAMLNRPELVIADEPTTAIDVTTQAQILHHVQRLCAERHTALVWITHDLSVVAGLADRIAVMYAGTIVEEGPVDGVLDGPMHPYTQALIRSVPSRAGSAGRFVQIPGLPPRLSDRPRGCAFRPRCALADSECLVAPPSIEREARHSVRCHHSIKMEVA